MEVLYVVICLNNKDFHIKNNKYHKSRRKTPWDYKDELSPIETFIRSNYLNAFNLHPKKLTNTNEADLLNAYTPTSCPYCGTNSFKKNGIYKTNLQKYTNSVVLHILDFYF